VHDVLFDVGREFPAEGPFSRLAVIRSPHELAPAGDGVFPLKHHDHSGSELMKVSGLRKRPLAVHGIKALGLDLVMCTIFMATIFNPRPSMRWITLPIRPRATPSV